MSVSEQVAWHMVFFAGGTLFGLAVASLPMPWSKPTPARLTKGAVMRTAMFCTIVTMVNVVFTWWALGRYQKIAAELRELLKLEDEAEASVMEIGNLASTKE